jgi:hypothetical protein
VIVLAIFLFYAGSTYQPSYSQGLLTPSSSPFVRITSPLSGQPVAVSNTGTMALTIYGTSIADSNYNAMHNCRVSVLLNNMLPYQTALPIGINGRNDYSKWMYSIMPFSIRSGMNTITAKLTCFTPFHMSFDSINIMGTSSLLQGIRGTHFIGPIGPIGTHPQPPTHIIRGQPPIGPIGTTPLFRGPHPIGPIGTTPHPIGPIGPTPLHPLTGGQQPIGPVAPPGLVGPPHIGNTGSNQTQ